MNDILIQKIIDSATFIAGGYAFIRKEDGNISIVNIYPPFHAAVIRENGEVLETNMDDIEIEIVLKHYWHKNKKYILDPNYA